MDPWSLLHPSLTNPAVCPILSPQTKQSQALQLNWPDKAFCSVVAPSATQTSELVLGISAKDFKEGRIQLIIWSPAPFPVLRQAEEPWEQLRNLSCFKAHLPTLGIKRCPTNTSAPCTCKAGDPESSCCLRWVPMPCLPTAQSSDVWVSPIPHPIPALPAAHYHKSCASPKALPE